MLKVIHIVFSIMISISISHAQDEIQWLTWEEMQVMQKRKARKVLIDVYTDWCGWCKRMDKNTFQKADIARYVNNNYYAVKFDAEFKDDIIFNGLKYSYVKSGRKGHHELAELILKGRLSFPTVVFLDEGLKVIQPIPGYQDSRSMELIVTYFARDYYKDTPWKKYTTMYNSNMIQDAGF